MEYGVHIPAPAVGSAFMGPCRHFRSQWRRRPWVHAQVDDGKGPDPIVIGTLGLMSGLLVVEPAYGLTKSWRPRRHHKKLGEKSFVKPYTEQADKEEMVRLGRIQKRQSTAVKSHAEPHTTARKTKEIVLSVQAPPSQVVSARSPSRSHLRRPSSYQGPSGGLWPVALAAFFVILVVFWKRIFRFLQGFAFRFKGTGPVKGKWIYDRSMGGKKIFVASDTQGASLLNPLEESRSPSEPAKVKKEKTVFMPSWWKSPPSLYVPSHVKEEAIKNARKLVIQLENSKISGQDYSLDMIMQLYKACESGGVMVSASSKNITTSIFRRGVEFAVDEALLVSNSLRGVKPTTFIPGYALFLNIDDAMAINIVHESVASKLRSLLLELAADIRSKGESPFFISPAATAFNNLATVLPLPLDSTEMYLISSMMMTAASPQEREQMYNVYKALHPSTTELLGVMLGKPVPQSAEGVDT